MPERLARARVAHHVKLEIVDPFVGRGDFLELQAEDALVNGEHAIEHFLEREEVAQRFRVDGVFLFLELVLVVAPIPDLDFRVGIIRLRGFHFLHLGNFRRELRLDAD